MRKTTFACIFAALTCFTVSSALAQDKVKLAIGQRGNWDTSVSEIGQRAGIFKKHGLELEIVYTQGAGETQQAVISGSVDIGIAAGIMGVLSAYSKGAPVRVIGAETTGAKDLYWYVKSDSPIKSLKDTDDKVAAPLDAVSKLDDRQASYRIEEFGDASSERASASRPLDAWPQVGSFRRSCSCCS